MRPTMPCRPPMTDNNIQENPVGSERSPAHFRPDGTLVSAFLQDHNWSCSPLDDPAQWPRPLRFGVSLVLDSTVPMWLAWGDDLCMVYNEAYAGIIGSKHPGALGAPLRQVWAEIWPDVEPLIKQTLSGRGLYREDLPLVINRKGHDEQTWFTFSYAPLRDDDGAIRGLMCTVWETTDKVL